MTAAPIHLAGERLMLDPMGALFWPEQRLLAVSDLHLEKGSSFARRGMLLPPWDTHATIDRLTLLLRRWSPATVVALGDSFHDARRVRPAAGHRAAPAERHDRGASLHLGAGQPRSRRRPTGWAAHGWKPTPPARWCSATRPSPSADPGEIVGHHHPKATIPARAGTVSRPCFVFDGRRLMMPAFGAYTGGLDVRDPAINRLFPRGGRVFLLGKDRLFSFEIGRGAALRTG